MGVDDQDNEDKDQDDQDEDQGDGDEGLEDGPRLSIEGRNEEQ